MYKPYFSFLCVALAVMAGAMLISCNKDDFIESDLPPKISSDYETGVFVVKIGEPLTISPDYKNTIAGQTQYSWWVNGTEVSDSPVFNYTWTEPGENYVNITVTTPAGSAREEFLVKVVEPAAPVISLPLTSDEITIAVGTDYVLYPEISNSEIDGFEVRWTVNGTDAGSDIPFVFKATEIGSFDVIVMARNAEGSDNRSFTVKVVDKLPYELSFPTPSYMMASTDRYTFAGRPVFLTPLTSGDTPTQWAWSVDGKTVDCTESTFRFTPDAPGEYTVNVMVDNSASASVKVICVEATESSRYRAARASSSAVCDKVYEWIPAPGQFIGETSVGGMTGNETTHEAAVAWAEKRLAAKNYVSLGGFGGYIIVGFDHSISKTDGNYDFAVMANAFLNASSGDGGSNEPGIVYVMQDVNGNGLPDDEWYELRGSETGYSTTRQDYAVTYYRPSAPKMNVQWTDNYGGTGTIDYLSAFHRQDYYYPAWVQPDSYTLRGTRLQAKTTQDNSTGFWDNWAFGWGYADNIGSDNMAGADGLTGEGQRNGFLIENAMYSDLTNINLQYIDFVKIQTGVNSKAGWLGEVSTEVFSVQDLNLMK